MAKEFSRKFYNSKTWKNIRHCYIMSRIREDGGMCEQCHERPGVIVHHKDILNPENIGDEYTSMHADNLELVCKECHDAEVGHFYDGRKKAHKNAGERRAEANRQRAWEMKQRPLKCEGFDENGNPIPKENIPPILKM